VSSTPSPWRYQGKLLENTGTGTSDLYDFGFRSYAPGLGAFTSLDDVSGSAQNPISLNRFLYADANPETLVDPDGHMPWDDIGNAVGNFIGGVGDAGRNAIGFGQGFVEGVGDTAVSLAQTAWAAPGAAADVLRCGADVQGCGTRTVFSAARSVWNLASDPAAHLSRAVGRVGAFVAARAQDLADTFRKGDFRSLGHVAGVVASSFIPVAGIASKLGLAGRLSRLGRLVDTGVAGRIGALTERVGGQATRLSEGTFELRIRSTRRSRRARQSAAAPIEGKSLHRRPDFRADAAPRGGIVYRKGPLV